ncbi:hypothetical protein STAN_1840 [Streptomyces sp. CBMAI 2042]|nr:hypothetical protein STAN_1840 [Streptomyces sp. CBMAI 2042]
MPDTAPTPDRPAEVLRAAATLLRAAAAAAAEHSGSSVWQSVRHFPDQPDSDFTTLTAGPGRPLHKGGGGRGAAPYMHAPVSEYIALVGPGVGLKLARWLESWCGVDLSEHGPMPEDAQHALAVARQLLGTSTGEATAAEVPTDARLFTLHLDASDGTCVAAHGIVWPGGAVTLHRPDAWQMPPGTGRSMDEALAAFCGPHRSLYRVEWAATPAAPPAPADRAAVLREAADVMDRLYACGWPLRRLAGEAAAAPEETQ